MSNFNLKKNWKLLAILGSVAVIVLVLVPGAATFLILLACPLMMVFMMSGMGMDHSGHAMHSGGTTSTTHSLQAHHPDNDQPDQQISQLQGQIQELQRSQVLLEEQLRQSGNHKFGGTSAPFSGGTNSSIEDVDEDKWPSGSISARHL